jgi:hypothetical protein
VLGAPALGKCRVLVQAEQAAHLAQDLGVALRLLRDAQVDCIDCPLRATCQAPSWNADLDTALRDLAEEWGLM